MSTQRTNLFDAFKDSNSPYSSETDLSDYQDPDFNIVECQTDGSEDSDSDIRPTKRPRPGPSTSTNRSTASSPSTSKGKGKGKSSKTRSTPISTTRLSNSEEILCTAGSDIDSSDESDTAPDDDHIDDDVDIAQLANDWNLNLTNFPIIPPFTGNSGLNANIVDTENATPLTCFRLFFNETILQHLKEETNRYAADLKRTPPHNLKKVVKTWKPVTLLELNSFILLLLHMGYVAKKSLNEYWTTNEFAATKFASRIMARDRFKAILSMLHFSNNEHYIEVNQPGHDPLYKVRTLYEHLQNRFEEVYTPERDIAVDEAMCGWRGKLRFKVYLRDKPTPWGIKFYELCESKSGYVHRFEIYAADPAISNRPTDVVLRLMNPLLDRGFHLYTDNYYSCPTLYEQLVERNTMCTGTVRANRLGMPKDLAKEKLKIGDTAYRRKESLVALKWRDKREVNLLTSAFDPKATTTVSTRNVTDKVKPSVVVAYTKNMAGVDHSDQLLSYLPLARRTAKWTTKLFMHLLTLSTVQASIILNKCRAAHGMGPMKLPNFVNKLGNQLKEEFIKDRGARSRPPPKQLTKPETLLRLDLSAFHHLGSLPATENKAKPRRQCKVCYDKSAKEPGKRKRGKETYVHCIICKIPLCIEPCFYLFHTKLDYTTDA